MNNPNQDRYAPRANYNSAWGIDKLIKNWEDDSAKFLQDVKNGGFEMRSRNTSRNPGYELTQTAVDLEIDALEFSNLLHPESGKWFVDFCQKLKAAESPEANATALALLDQTMDEAFHWSGEPCEQSRVKGEPRHYKDAQRQAEYVRELSEILKTTEMIDAWRQESVEFLREIVNGEVSLWPASKAVDIYGNAAPELPALMIRLGLLTRLMKELIHPTYSEEFGDLADKNDGQQWEDVAPKCDGRD